MDLTRRQNTTAALTSLEAAAASARGGFGCMFSSADEYETALVAVRRAQGRYNPPRSRWPTVTLVGCAMILIGAVLLFR